MKEPEEESVKIEQYETDQTDNDKLVIDETQNTNETETVEEEEEMEVVDVEKKNKGKLRG